MCRPPIFRNGAAVKIYHLERGRGEGNYLLWSHWRAWNGLFPELVVFQAHFARIGLIHRFLRGKNEGPFGGHPETLGAINTTISVR